MDNFKLTNLRELSTEEQIRLNGGCNPATCSGDCSGCSCTCECRGQDQSNSTENSFQKTGSTSLSGRKQREAMQAM